jgi:uncharacterized protein (TIGR04255 family)
MADEINTNKTLSKNSIKSFILKIDLIMTDRLVIPDIASKISKHFDRAEKRQISNLEIAFTKGSSAIKHQNTFDYVLISEQSGVSMVFSETQNAFWIESSQYKDNSLYKNIIMIAIDSIIELCGEVQSKRIGLRYINEFKCEKAKNVNSIYGKRLTSIMRQMISKANKSRIIGLEEYNNDGYKIRLQYGVPNKFYPSPITVFDLLLDIDSYIENTNSITEWSDVIKILNHSAYDCFVEEINPKYLEELK